MSVRQRCLHGLRLVLQQSQQRAAAGGLGNPLSGTNTTALQQQLQQQHASSWWRRCFATTRGGPTRPNPTQQTGSKAAAAGASKQPPSTTQTQQQLPPFQQWWRSFQRVPNVPKVLGLMGAIPFIALAPPVCKHLAFLLPTTVAENCAMIQVCYGVVIVTFLGAVHWGVAMASPLTNPVAARIANEAFVYSVLPSLVAWPVALMEPGAGSLMLSVLLPACYMADYTRRNLGLPVWYMALRVPLTLAATFGMLLTATRYLHLEMDRLQRLQDAEAAAASSSEPR